MIKADELQSLQQGHRARLRQKFLDGHLVGYEILELLLTYAIPRRDVRMLARQLYNKYKNIDDLLSAPIESLMSNEGVKENTAILFKVIHKITQLKYKSKLINEPVYHNYDQLERYCRSVVGGKTVEEFHVLYLDANYQMIKDETHSIGTVDWAAVYVREIVKKALDLNARSIVLLHNHPTPEKSFSMEDLTITKDLAVALKKLDIELFDHFLISGGILYSARNLHVIN